MASRVKSLASIVATEVNRVLLLRAKLKNAAPYPKLDSGPPCTFLDYVEIAAENFGPDDIVAQLSDYIIKTHPHGLCDMKESGALALNVSPVETRSCVSFSYQLLAGVHHFALRPRYINEGI